MDINSAQVVDGQRLFPFLEEKRGANCLFKIIICHQLKQKKTIYIIFYREFVELQKIPILSRQLNWKLKREIFGNEEGIFRFRILDHIFIFSIFFIFHQTFIKNFFKTRHKLKEDLSNFSIVLSANRLSCFDIILSQELIKRELSLEL